MNNETNMKNYLTIDDLSDFLQSQGYSTSKPSLVKQQMYGVMMRSLPEKELFGWSRDTRKRLYHRFSVFESIAASLLFSGRYWNAVKGIHAARLVHFDVFIGRLGFFVHNFPKMDASFGIQKHGNNPASTFSFSMNDVFRKFIQESDYFKITEEKNGQQKYKIEIVEKKYNTFNSQYSDKEIEWYYKDYKSFTDVLIINNEIRMALGDLGNVYNNLGHAACKRIFNGTDADCYMQYQTMLYTRTMEEVIARYNAKLTDFITKR
jgi:hypothetical protein